MCGNGVQEMDEYWWMEARILRGAHWEPEEVVSDEEVEEDDGCQDL